MACCSTPHLPDGRLQPDLRQVGVRRQADRSLEQADQLKGGQVNDPPHILKRQSLAISILHQRLNGRDGAAVAGRDRNALPFAAVPAKQLTEASDKSFAREKGVRALLQRAVKVEKGFNQVDVAEYVGREVRDGGNPESFGQALQRGFSQIEAAIAPARTSRHAS